MAAAEETWKANAESGDMTLVERWNYHNELGAQLPLRRLRVIYAASGTIPAACLLRSSPAILEHAVYWAEVTSENEGLYLTALINSETARARVAAMQARGQWGARHFDKVMFALPISRFDASVALHNELAAAAAEAERLAQAFELPDAVKFQRARKLVREALIDSGVAQRIDYLVARLLDEAPGNGVDED